MNKVLRDDGVGDGSDETVLVPDFPSNYTRPNSIPNIMSLTH